MLTYRQSARRNQPPEKGYAESFSENAEASIGNREGVQNTSGLCSTRARRRISTSSPQIDPKFLAELWPHGNIRPSYLYAEGNFKPLAHYLIKETRRTFRDKLVSDRQWNP